MVDKRTLEKYEREAKEKNRESWYLSWALDTNQVKYNLSMAFSKQFSISHFFNLLILKNYQFIF